MRTVIKKIVILTKNEEKLLKDFIDIVRKYYKQLNETCSFGCFGDDIIGNICYTYVNRLDLKKVVTEEDKAMIRKFELEGRRIKDGFHGRAFYCTWEELCESLNLYFNKDPKYRKYIDGTYIQIEED